MGVPHLSRSDLLKGPAASSCEQPQVPLQRDPRETGAFPALHTPMGIN